MARAGIDLERVVFDLEDDSVLLVNADAPPARKVAFERFWFPNAIVTVALYALQKLIDALDGLFVAPLPFKVFFPGAIVPELLHATDLRRRVEEVRRILALGFILSSTSMRSW